MLKAIKGTKDLLPSEAPRWQYLEGIVKQIFSNFNYKEIRTPIFEATSLFARSIGEETDIVGKEMYTFTDKGGNSITLKPEMTAGVVRAFNEHSLGAQQQLTKLYYISPMFRQERPQAGRFRQFHQFGAEAIGSKSPLLDAEMIEIAYYILKQLGLKDLVVKINSLGVTEDREVFRSVIRKYLANRIQEMSEESQRRYNSNILRIFDSKIEEDKMIMKVAPKMTEYLSEESKRNIDVVKKHLTNIGIPFEIDHTLFRGLDYYTETTFEIISKKVGSQTALLGGGRYDQLVQKLGGKPTPAVGFAAGIERILLACENEQSFKISPKRLNVYLVLENDKGKNINVLESQSDDSKINEAKSSVARIAHKLRKKGLSVDFDYMNRSIKGQKREANKNQAEYTITINSGDSSTDNIVVQDMIRGIKRRSKLSNLLTAKDLKSWFNKVSVKSKVREREVDFIILKESHPNAKKEIEFIMEIKSSNSIKSASQRFKIESRVGLEIWKNYLNNGIKKLIEDRTITKIIN